MQLQKIRTPFVSTHIDHRALFIYIYVRMYVCSRFVCFYNVLQGNKQEENRQFSY